MAKNWPALKVLINLGIDVIYPIKGLSPLLLVLESTTSDDIKHLMIEQYDVSKEDLLYSLSNLNFTISTQYLLKKYKYDEKTIFNAIANDNISASIIRLLLGHLDIKVDEVSSNNVFPAK